MSSTSDASDEEPEPMEEGQGTLECGAKSEKASVVQKFFEKTGKTRARCKNCQAELTTKGGTTSTLHRHLKKNHLNDYDAARKKTSAKQKTLKDFFSAPGPGSDVTNFIL